MLESISQLFNNFGVSWEKLIGQIVTFAILLVGLRIILYKPILTMLEERKTRIAQGLQDAAEAAEARQAADALAAQRLAEANQKADALMQEATKTAEQLKEELTIQTQTEIQRLRKQHEQDMLAAQQEMMRQVRSEMAQLVVVTTEKVLDKHLSDADKQALIDQATKELA